MFVDEEFVKVTFNDGTEMLIKADGNEVYYDIYRDEDGDDISLEDGSESIDSGTCTNVEAAKFYTEMFINA